MITEEIRNLKKAVKLTNILNMTIFGEAFVRLERLKNYTLEKWQEEEKEAITDNIHVHEGKCDRRLARCRYCETLKQYPFMIKGSINTWTEHVNKARSTGYAHDFYWGSAEFVDEEGNHKVIEFRTG